MRHSSTSPYCGDTYIDLKMIRTTVERDVPELERRLRAEIE